MTIDAYKTPEAQLLSETANNQFYVVSKKKFSVLYISTLGVYTVYWFYINWRNYKNYTDEKIIPVLRAIFYIFFTHSLFNKVDEKLKKNERIYTWSPTLVATSFILLSIVSNVLDRLSQKEIGSPLTDILSLLMLPILLPFLLKAQGAINQSEDDPLGESNSRFTLQNYLWIALGAIIWFFALLGILDMYGIISLEA